MATSAARSGTSAAAAQTFPQNADFKACMVSDAGGFNARSFNQIGAAGLDRAAEEIGVQEVKVESADENAYAPNIDGLVAQVLDDDLATAATRWHGCPPPRRFG